MNSHLRYGQTWGPVHGSNGSIHEFHLYEPGSGFVKKTAGKPLYLNSKQWTLYHLCLHITVRHFQYGSGPYIHSFKFTDTDGVQSQEYQGTKGNGRFLRESLPNEEDCRLAFISGQVTPVYLATFWPHFECPAEDTPPAPSPPTKIWEGDKAGTRSIGSFFSDEDLYYKHGPVTRIEIRSGSWIDHVRARFKSGLKSRLIFFLSNDLIHRYGLVWGPLHGGTGGNRYRSYQPSTGIIEGLEGMSMPDTCLDGCKS